MKNRSFSKVKKVAVVCVLFAGAVQAASAGIIFSEPDVAPPGVAGSFFNVRFNNDDSKLGPSTTVTGTAGTVRDRFLIDFKSNEPLTALDVPANPPNAAIPPQVRGTDFGFTRIGVSVRDGAFTTLFLNFRAPNVGGNPAGRFADITVTAFDGTRAEHTLELGNGGNFLRVDATGDTLLRDLSFLSPFEMLDVRTVRIGGLQEAPVPEPATLLSLGIGMAGLVAVRRLGRVRGAAVPGAQSAPV